MAAVVIAGVSYDVIQAGATEEEPLRKGGATRAFDMKLRMQGSSTKRTWVFPLVPLTFAQYVTLAANAAAGFQTCSGDLINASVTCMVVIRAAPFIVDTGVKKRLPVVVLTEQ